MGRVFSGIIAGAILIILTLSLLGQVFDFSGSNIPFLQHLRKEPPPLMFYIFCGAVFGMVNPSFTKQFRKVVTVLRKRDDSDLPNYP